jgi:hypothetical protein
MERLSAVLGHAVQFVYTCWDRIVTPRWQVASGDANYRQIKACRNGLFITTGTFWTQSWGR